MRRKIIAGLFLFAWWQVCLYLFAPTTHAIIVTPALILLPLAKIIGSLLAAVGVPLTGWSLWPQRWRSISKGKLFALISLITLNLALLVSIVLLIHK